MFIAHNHSLLPHNTFGLDVKADTYIEYSSADELRAIISNKTLDGRRTMHIGGGSNLLFTGDFNGTVLHSAIKFINYTPTDNGIEAHVGAGIVWDDFCLDAATRGLWGIENLSAIPGEVGASAVQNIGAYGMEACDTITAVETIDSTTGQTRTFKPEECNYGYRYSIFKEDRMRRYIVTSVHFRLSETATPKLDYAGLAALKNSAALTPIDVRNTIVAIRDNKLPDPRKIGSAGSFFKNPVIGKHLYEKLLIRYPQMPHYEVDSEHVKIPAAWLIEQCGLKGHRHGGAQVYERQPLVIINSHHATATDIVLLAQHVQQSVLDKFGIAISPEVNYI